MSAKNKIILYKFVKKSILGKQGVYTKQKKSAYGIRDKKFWGPSDLNTERIQPRGLQRT